MSLTDEFEAQEREKAGHKLVAKAKDKIKESKGFLCYFFSNSKDKIREAVDYYERAGDEFRMANQHIYAGNAYKEAAIMHYNNNRKFDASLLFELASKSYKDCNFQHAVDCLTKSINSAMEFGNMTIAAHMTRKLAEWYEKKNNSLELSLPHYERAAEYYEGDGYEYMAKLCRLKEVEYVVCELRDYNRAIAILENFLKSRPDKDIMFKAVICRLLIDIEEAEIALQKFCKYFPSLQFSWRCSLVEKLIS